MNQQELPLFEEATAASDRRRHLSADEAHEDPVVPMTKSRGGRAVDFEELDSISRRASAAAYDLRARLLAPSREKVAPTLPINRIATMLGVATSDVLHAAGKAGGGYRTQRYTVSEVHDIARSIQAENVKASGLAAAVVAVTHTKGGVGKTTTAMTLAQGLSLRGHRVLAIDADPQASLSTLFGLLPEVDVAESTTLMPVLRGDLDDALAVARRTYWANIDLIPSAPALFGAEYSLYGMALDRPQAQFWALLDKSLKAARLRYDVIIIDTPPALSCLTINALMAANGLVIPLPPTALDFSSLAQLWALLSEIGRAMGTGDGRASGFDFVHVLPSRVDSADAAVPVVLRWINAVYGDLVTPKGIPKTAATSSSSAEFNTVYDLSRRQGSERTYQRAVKAYDQMVAAIESSIARVWREKDAGGMRP